MSDKKVTIKKFNYYLIFAFIILVLFLGYIAGVVFANKSNLSWETANGNFHLALTLWKNVNKIYTSPVSVLTSWGNAIMLSYCLGFVIAGIGWFLEWRKRTQAEKQEKTLKNKLDKLENEKNFYKKKYEILEKGINSSAPPEDKKASKKAKENKTTMYILVFIMVLVVTGLVGSELIFAKDDKKENQPTKTEQVKNADDSRSTEAEFANSAQ